MLITPKKYTLPMVKALFLFYFYLFIFNTQVKMLTKELELLRANDEQSKENLQESELSVRDLEKMLKQKEWELVDERNMNQAKTADLETQIQQLKASMKKAQQNFQHKFAELDRYAREKEASLLAAKEVPSPPPIGFT